MTSLQFELVPRVCAVEQLLDPDVSTLGFPLPFFGGFGVLRCLKDLPPGVLRVWSAAGPGKALKVPTRQLGNGWQSKHFWVNTRGG